MEQLNYFKLRNVEPVFDKNQCRPPIFLADKIPADKNIKILDIGCGFGNILLGLRNIGYTNLKGIDTSSDAINFCKNNNLNVSLESIQSYTERSTEKFDLITINHVIEHLKKDDIINMLKNIHDNLLSENGQMFITVPNAQSSTGCYWAYEDFTHETLFTAGSLFYVLKAAGFSEIEFLDMDCTAGLKKFEKLKKKIQLKLYKKVINTINKITSSSFHRPSPAIYSFEIKALAKK